MRYKNPHIVILYKVYYTIIIEFEPNKIHEQMLELKRPKKKINKKKDI